MNLITCNNNKGQKTEYCTNTTIKNVFKTK